jgi:hypothetical protein
MKVFDAVTNLAQLSGRFRRPDAAGDAQAAPGSGGPLAALETRLAGVVVAALKEAFDRDRARMDLERAHLDAERQRAEEALRAELRRQAAERALGQVKLIAVMAIGVWMLSAALGVWLPGMRTGGARWVLGGGWLLVIAALACAFSAWQRIAVWSGSDAGARSAPVGPGLAEATAPWLLLGAIAFSGAALLMAL